MPDAAAAQKPGFFRKAGLLFLAKARESLREDEKHIRPKLDVPAGNGYSELVGHAMFPGAAAASCHARPLPVAPPPRISIDCRR